MEEALLEAGVATAAEKTAKAAAKAKNQQTKVVESTAEAAVEAMAEAAVETVVGAKKLQTKVAWTVAEPPVVVEETVLGTAEEAMMEAKKQKAKAEEADGWQETQAKAR